MASIFSLCNLDINETVAYYYPNDNIQLQIIKKLLKHEQEAINMINKMWLFNRTQIKQTHNNKINYYYNIKPFKTNLEKFYTKGIYICLKKYDILCEIQHYYSGHNSYWLYEFKKIIDGKEFYLISSVWYGDTNYYK